MYCPRCGSKYEEGERFCKYCGESLENKFSEKYDFHQPEKITDETLEKAFIGPNYDKIKQEKFSFPAFFFGFYYLLYRKMWLYTLAWITIIILASIFISEYMIVLNVGMSILIGIFFNKFYIKHVSKKIDKIKANNQDKTQEELLKICKKKGGNSPLAIVIVIFAFIIILTALVTIFSISKFSKFITNDTIYSRKDNYQIEELSYEVPSQYSLSNYSTDTYKNYKKTNEDEYCRLSISSHGTYSYKTEEEYLKKSVYASVGDKVSDIQTITINNNDWKLITVEKEYKTSYTYVILYKDKIYEVEYEIQKDSDTCSTDYKTFLNTLRLIDDDLITS